MKSTNLLLSLHQTPENDFSQLGPAYDVIGKLYSVNTPVSQVEKDGQLQIQKFICTVCVDKKCSYMENSESMTYGLCWMVIINQNIYPDEEYNYVSMLEDILMTKC